MYLHRKTCFEGLGVEQAILSRWSGFGPIHTILDNSTQDPFLKGTHEQFEFISLEALLVLLDSNDPLLVSDSQTLFSLLMEEVKCIPFYMNSDNFQLDCCQVCFSYNLIRFDFGISLK